MTKREAIHNLVALTLSSQQSLLPVVLTKAGPLPATAPTALIRDSGIISLIPPTDKIFLIILKSSEVMLLPPEYTEIKNKMAMLSQCERCGIIAINE